MPTEMGEYIVGAYLKLILECDVVDYNARPPGGGLAGLGELDVIGLSFGRSEAYLCEVTTHLDGLLIGSGVGTIRKITDKFQRQRTYASTYLPKFKPHFMFWSPVVRSGLVPLLAEIDGLDLFVNERYADAVGALQDKASKVTSDANNPAFRMLQILTHMRPRTCR